ncbi:MAG TPA: ammonia channel protein, partial [Caulobacteraceae bacterium]|nr:ammonia channel protein [Caulobacteraceae bacterium]
PDGHGVLTQLYGCIGTIVWTALITFLILMVCKFTTGLRVPEDGEREGLDITLHGETIHD